MKRPLTKPLHPKYSRLKKNRDLYIKLQIVKYSFFVLGALLLLYFGQKVIANAYIFHPVQALADDSYNVRTVHKEIIKTEVKEVEVDRTFTTEKQQILAYLVEKFGNDADKAIIMIGTCENSTFAADRKSPLNIQQSGRRSYDIGVMQINVDEKDLEEQKKLTNWKYNIDRGYAKYKSAGNKFTAWTCATKIGQKNYLGQ